MLLVAGWRSLRSGIAQNHQRPVGISRRTPRRRGEYCRNAAHRHSGGMDGECFGRLVRSPRAKRPIRLGSQKRAFRAAHAPETTSQTDADACAGRTAGDADAQTRSAKTTRPCHPQYLGGSCQTRRPIRKGQCPIQSPARRKRQTLQ